MIAVYVWMICKGTGTRVSGTKKGRPHLVVTEVMWVFAVVSEGLEVERVCCWPVVWERGF
jgi:hypothetical protein